MKKFLQLTALLLLFTVAATAQVFRTFSPRYNNPQENGNIFFVANNIITTTGVATTEVPPAGSNTNNGGNGVYIDIDGDAATFSSSSADLALPNSCSSILFAGLYWGASLGGTNNSAWRTASKDTVKLKMPGSASYIDIVSTQTDIHDYNIPDATQNHVGYTAFRDITSIINTTSPDGTYMVANVKGPTGLTNCAGGWCIVVVYKDPLDPTPRNLVVFDGSAIVSSTTYIDVPFGGFQTPVVGPVGCDLGVVCYDGDRSYGDGFYFKQDSANAPLGSFLDMSLAANCISTSISGDSWNSTISHLGSVVTTRSPAHQNTLGFDADIVRLVNPGNVNLGNNKTSARIRMNSAGEKYFLQVITSAISVAEPEFIMTKTSFDLNGATFAPGDSLHYTINWQNVGSDTAVKTVIVDTIPFNLVYKKNSLKINGVPKTDAAGDDEAEWDAVGKRVIFRVGTGANATTGGQVLPAPLSGNSGTVSFTTNATNICQILACSNIVSNIARIDYQGKTSGNYLFNYSGNGIVNCAVGGPTYDTIVGFCNNAIDTFLINSCPQPNLRLPVDDYPQYTIYRDMPFIPANLFTPSNAILTTPGIYYGHAIASGGCQDTVIFKVRLVVCIDIDDDNDGIPDYVETNNPLALQDADNDGVPNWNDTDYPGYVDHNSDNVNDNFDAGADSDNDSIPNFYERDFPGYADVNGDGINDNFDFDLDGIINQYDLDSDNDGIPDTVESYGVDTNGDGIIDNYTDTDSDGFSQNVDANNTGSSGSDVGLGNPDLDGDGQPNYLDLDSDNDGIPDVVEVFGTDVNNNGVIDGYVDTDVDGFADAVDGDVGNDGTVENAANALLRTGPDTSPVNGRADNYPYKNFDGDGRPNCYDLDSDDDGIVDVIEAGFTDANYNGKIDGTYGADGWCDAIAALSSLNLYNTDTRGNPDYLDIDADDDGIPDQIEGQPTVSPLPAQFYMPAFTDTDNDGLDDAYDNMPGIFAGSGIVIVDKDADGIPDYRDLDTDSDGIPDIIEGNDFNLNGIADDNVTLTLSDVDGDGLDDRFDSSNTSIKGTSYNLTTGGYNAGDIAPGTRAPVQRTHPGQQDRDWRDVGSVVLLPVQFTYFSATQNKNQVLLNWTILTGKEIDHFQLERSLDKVIFSKRAKIKQPVPVNEAKSFTGIDEIRDVAGNDLYYRITAVSETGAVAWSNILAVKRIPTVAALLNIEPNPASGFAHLKFNSKQKDNIQLRLIDKAGRVVLQKSEMVSKGQNDLLLTGMEKLNAGIYVVQLLFSNSEIITEKLVIGTAAR